MIKNLLTAAAIALLAAGSAFAQQTIFIGAQGYDDLQAACDDAKEGDVIKVTADQTLTDRINIGNGDTKIAYTIEGEDGVKITRNANNMLFLLWKNSNVTIKNLILDGAGFANKAIENKNSGSTLAVEDCSFVNFPDDAQVIQTNKEASFKNIDMSTCAYSQALFVGQSTTTLAGEIKCNMYLEGSYTVTQEGDLTGAVNVYLQTVAAERVVVKNCSTPDVYTLCGAEEGYSLKLNDANNDLVVDFTKNVAMIEAEGVEPTYYTSLVAAFKAATDDQTVVVLENCDLTDRLLGEKTITLKGATDGIVINRTDTDKNHLMIESKNRTLTIQNLTFDCNNIDISKPVVSIHNNGGSGIVLDNVKFLNAKSSVGIIVAGAAGRNVSLNNVTAENTVEGTKGIVMSGNLVLNGDNNIPVELGETGKISVPEGGELTNAEPIELTLATVPELGTTIVAGTTASSKFQLTNEGYYLVAGEDNNLVLSDRKPSGIEDVVVDENAPVEYYNLSGMRVNGDNMAPGVYIKRQGAKATKVYVK